MGLRRQSYLERRAVRRVMLRVQLVIQVALHPVAVEGDSPAEAEAEVGEGDDSAGAMNFLLEKKSPVPLLHKSRISEATRCDNL